MDEAQFEKNMEIFCDQCTRKLESANYHFRDEKERYLCESCFSEEEKKTVSQA